MESTPTVSVNETPDPVHVYLRSCDIYANGSVVASTQVGNETRAHKKLDPVEMYWRSREIYENEYGGRYEKYSSGGCVS